MIGTRKALRIATQAAGAAPTVSRRSRQEGDSSRPARSGQYGYDDAMRKT